MVGSKETGDVQGAVAFDGEGDLVEGEMKTLTESWDLSLVRQQ